MADMNRIVSLVPDSPVGYVARGGMYSEVNEYEKAEADLREAMEIDPDNLAANTNMGWLNFLQQEYAEAIKFNERAIATDPERAEPRFNLAACLLALGQTDRALAANRQAIAVNVSPLRASEAIKDLQRLKQVQPDTPGLDQMIQEIQASLEKLE